MIRFKVIKASKLLLYLAAGIFILVLAVLIARYFLSDGNQSAVPMANFVNSSAISHQSENEAKTLSVFASDDISDNYKFPFDPGKKTGIEIEIIDDDPHSPANSIENRILIYHTHTHEAYEQVPNDPYVALEAWRTNDEDHSVVRIGKELAHLLRGYGFEVVHDTTDHETNQLSTAYSRSLATLESYSDSFDLYIDLHRDAYIEGMTLVHKDACGNRFAPMMFLIGNGNGFKTGAHYDENYLFAQKLTNRINALSEGLCKEVLVKDGRYNQHIGPFSVLIEVGHNKNTLQEALNSTPILAKAIYSLLCQSPDPEITCLSGR